MIKSVVIDFDGTLSDLTHRLHFINGNKKDWDGFFGAVGKDALNKWCAELMLGLSRAYHPVIIVSGRPERTRKASEQWLIDNDIHYDQLILVREDGDHAPDDLLKEKLLKSFGPENILFVVDDRQRVVDMWRRNGVVCLQCNVWEEKT